MGVQYQYSKRAGYPHLRVFRRRWLLPDVVYAEGLLLGEWSLAGPYPRTFSLVVHVLNYRLEIRLVARRRDPYHDSEVVDERLWQPLKASEGCIRAVDFKNDGWVAEWMERYGLIEHVQVNMLPDGHTGRLLIILKSQTAQAHGQSRRGHFDPTPFPHIPHHHKMKY